MNRPEYDHSSAIPQKEGLCGRKEIKDAPEIVHVIVARRSGRDDVSRGPVCAAFAAVFFVRSVLMYECRCQRCRHPPHGDPRSDSVF